MLYEKRKENNLKYYPTLMIQER